MLYNININDIYIYIQIVHDTIKQDYIYEDNYLFICFKQINLLNDKKLELERRIDSLVTERESLSVTLDESTDRIIMLEKQSREQEQLVCRKSLVFSYFDIIYL